MAGAHLPRKDTARKQSREALKVVAYMIGVMLCNERNRAKLTQEQLAQGIGVQQIQISLIENGDPSAEITDAKIDALFKQLDLAEAEGHAAFLKWWRANAKSLGAR